MYDSRSDHPHKGVHWPRSWREMGEGDRIEWGTPRARILATPRMGRLTITEGLAEFEFSLLAEWEQVLLDSGATPMGLGRLARRDFEREYGVAYGRSHDHLEDARPSYTTSTRRASDTRTRNNRRTNRQEAIRMNTTTHSTRLNAVLADIRPETPATIRRPVIAKRAFSRLSAERFDPSKVSRTLSPHAAG